MIARNPCRGFVQPERKEAHSETIAEFGNLTCMENAVSLVLGGRLRLKRHIKI